MGGSAATRHTVSHSFNRVNMFHIRRPGTSHHSGLRPRYVDLLSWPAREELPMRNARRTCAMPFAGLFAAALLLAGSLAEASDYPNRPIRIVVPTAAGSSPDILARLLQPYLERSLRQPIIIDNRAGASTMIGTDAVAKAAPDGYTLLIVNTTFTVNGALNSGMSFDAEKDFEPVALLVKNPLLFATHSKVPAHTLGEFVSLVRAEPGKFNYGTSGASTQAHLLI